jgi:hypothetical protein
VLGSILTLPQETLPVGATLIPIILGSDKTRLTILGGNKQAWPLYLSIGNIPSKTRSLLSTKTWVVLAYIPIVCFEGKHSKALEARYFHQCIRHILAPLVSVRETGSPITLGNGNVLNCFFRLAAWIADYEEQVLLNCIKSRSSTTTLAGSKELGKPDPAPLRTREFMLGTLDRLAHECDVADMDTYKMAAKSLGLSAVNSPFWLDHPEYDPSLTLSPDILHGLHKLWRDHILSWTQNIIGKEELDARISCLQPVVGFRHFKVGISKMSQWTGHDDRELERVLVAVAAGAVPRKVMKALRAFHDFLYLAQYESHSKTTLGYLKDALSSFHKYKEAFIQEGGCTLKHFNIPKIAALHSYERHILEMGSSLQYSSESIETLHKSVARAPYQASNFKDYHKQMTRHLDRAEKLAYIQDFLEWHDGVHSGPSTKSVDQKSRLHLTKSPHQPHTSLSQIAEVYDLPDLQPAMADVLLNLKHPHVKILTGKRISPKATDLSHLYVDVWHSVRVALPKVQNDEQEAKTHTIRALPPSPELPHGLCHCALIHVSPALDTGVQG